MEDPVGTPVKRGWAIMGEAWDNSPNADWKLSVLEMIVCGNETTLLMRSDGVVRGVPVVVKSLETVQFHDDAVHWKTYFDIPEGSEYGEWTSQAGTRQLLRFRRRSPRLLPRRLHLRGAPVASGSGQPTADAGHPSRGGHRGARRRRRRHGDLRDPAGARAGGDDPRVGGDQEGRPAGKWVIVAAAACIVLGLLLAMLPDKFVVT